MLWYRQRRGLVQIGAVSERESSGERFLQGLCGTCLGALYENTAYTGVNGNEGECRCTN